MAVRLIFLPLSQAGAGSPSTGAGAADGVATVDGRGKTKSTAAGAIAAGAAVAGHGKAKATTTGAAAGDGEVSGVSRAKSAGAGAAAGAATVAGAGKVKAPGTGNADGVATVAGVSPSPSTSGAGAADGHATVAGAAPTRSKAAGVAAGVATVAGAARTASKASPTITTGATVDGRSTTRATGAGQADGVAIVDGQSSVPHVMRATYDFANVLDLVTVKPCRLTSLIKSTIFNSADVFSLREGNVSTWPSFVGAVSGHEADAKLYVAATDDDPASPSAAWGEWNRLDSSEFVSRGFKFYLELLRYDASFNIAIDELAVYAEAP